MNNNKQINKQFKSLPNNIELHIFEYNVEHRIKMKSVFEIIKKPKNICYICNKIKFSPYSYLLELYICSPKCLLLFDIPCCKL